jgi:hypothetical protein
MTETRTVRYEGNPAFVSLLAQLLREEGVTVDYAVPEEHRGTVDIVEQVVLNLLCTGTYEAIRAGARKFTERSRGRDKASVEGEDDD